MEGIEDYLQAHRERSTSHERINGESRNLSDRAICQRINGFRLSRGHYPFMRDIFEIFPDISKGVLNEKLFLLRAKGIINYDDEEKSDFSLTAKGKIIVEDFVK